MVYLVFGKLVYLLWPFFATAQIFIVVNGQRLNKNIAIWSHWKRGKKRERGEGGFKMKQKIQFYVLH